MKKNYQIIATGHSLGGAMAQCFIYFSLINKKIGKENLPKTITYGQPKVGNYYFAKFLDENAFLNLRIVNKNDLVPKIPFSSGIINNIFYFFNYIEPQYTYYHTKNEKEQHQILILPIFVIICLFFSKLIIILIITATIIWPISILIKGFISIYNYKKEWSELGYFSIPIFLVLLSFVLYIFNGFIDILNIYKESKITCLFMIIIISILLYTFLIVFTKLVLIIKNLYFEGMKSIDNFFEQFKKFIKELTKQLTGLIASFVSLVSFSLVPLGNIGPHITYQNTEGRKIIDLNEKKNILKLEEYENSNKIIQDAEIIEVNNKYIIMLNNQIMSRKKKL